MVGRQDSPFYQVVTVAAPAAGVDWTFKAPGQGWWRVISVQARLVTSAVVANRNVSIRADDQTDLWFASAAPTPAVASQTTRYGAFGGANGAGAAGAVVNIGLPLAGLILPPGNRLLAVTTGLDPLDQWSQIAVMVQEFPQGPVVGWMPTLDTSLIEMG